MRQSEALKVLNDLFEVIVKPGWRVSTNLANVCGERIMRLRMRAEGGTLAPNAFYMLISDLTFQKAHVDALLRRANCQPLPDAERIGTAWEPEVGPTSAQVTEAMIAVAKVRRAQRRGEWVEEV
jgi:hypothetical protein